MKKTILITGSTDGIGFATAKILVEQGHNVIIHGRSVKKVEETKAKLGIDKAIVADLSDIAQVKQMIEQVKTNYPQIDVLINNAGVYTVPETTTNDNLDVRFVVNTIAPYFLTKGLLPALSKNARIVNLSSAAQAPVSIEALLGNKTLADGEAYAQSKLALTMLSFYLAKQTDFTDKVVIAVNPGSLLGSKMVKDAYGIQGADISIGADILTRAALTDEFLNATGKYFDNDSSVFANPHKDALSSSKNEKLINTIDSILADM